jgi:endonuclease-3
MTTSNRAATLNKIHKVLKRSYKHAPVKGEHPVLETMLFACLLENAHCEVARQAFTTVQGAFFDWNEIRVSTVKELAEVMDKLPEPMEAAARLKGVLQTVFESDYSFELENLKKQNIGAAVKRMQKLQGSTPFNIAYTTQTALGGHAIPIDKGVAGALYVLGAISENECKEQVVPGIERAIPKSKGQEFGALLHELGADFFANPFSPSLREFMLSIAPDAKERFPKRAPKKPPAPPAPPPAPAKGVAAAKKDKGKEVKHVKEAPGKKSAAKGSEKHVARGPKVAAHPKKKPSGGAKKTPAKALSKRRPR